MERKKVTDFPPEVLKLFDGSVHGSKTRREFLDEAAKFAIGGVSAAAMLESLQPNFSWAQEVKKDDARISAAYIDYDSPQGSGPMKGYFAKPVNASARLPGILVIHENRGLNPYIEDVTRRLALLNYVAFAPDALSPLGGYPGDEDKARDLFAKQDGKKRIEDLVTAASTLKSRAECTGKIGAIGFCFGGGIVNLLATRMPDLVAGVPYYGTQPTADETAKIKAALLIHYAANDDRVNAGWPAFEVALKSHQVRYEMHRYDKTEHGFHNDTTPRYDESAAKLSWSRSIAFFNKHLKDI